MKKRHKLYLKINIVSLFFVVISFTSVTLAWFAYSGLSKTSMDIGVKGWYIEMDKNGEPVTKDIVITLDDIYPGMKTVNEKVTIKNHGDYDASVKYKIVSARLLGNSNDNYVINDDNITSSYVEDKLSHQYPFHINMSLDKGYVISNSDNVTFKVSVSWPLDSGDNILDSTWGTAAYKFQSAEKIKANNVNYQPQSSIQIVISLTAEQYVENESSSDFRYDLGDTILFDVSTNLKCNTISSTCLETHVINKNSTLGETTIMLLPTINNLTKFSTQEAYTSELSNMTSTWASTTRALTAEDILGLVSLDITSSEKIRNNISNSIIGNLTYANRMTTEINNIIASNGYYRYLNSSYSYLMSNTCYWTSSSYNSISSFAVSKIDDSYSKLYNELNGTSCKVVPIIVVNKSNVQ